MFARRQSFVQRLKTRPQFQAVLAGALVAKTAHFAMHRCALIPPGLVAAGGEMAGLATLFPVDTTWLGTMVPKRWAKRAVTRNAIKRQTYTVAIDFTGRLSKSAFVVRLRCEFVRSSFASASSVPLKLAIRSELQALFAVGVRAS